MRLYRLLFPFLLCALTVTAPVLFAQESRENADFKLAVKLFDDTLYDLALEQLKQYVNLYPNTKNGIEARFYLGLSQMKLGQFEDARFTFQNFALTFGDHPRAPEAWTKVAEACVALNLPREAALAYERVRTFHPRSPLAPGALLKASEFFKQGGDPENSRGTLRVLTQEYASADAVVPARLMLATDLLEEGKYENAATEARKAADAAKTDSMKAAAQLLLSNAQILGGKPEEAERTLQGIVKSFLKTDSYAPAVLLLGNLRRDLGKSAEAVQSWNSIAFDSLRASSQIRQSALIELGAAAERAEEFRNAGNFYERAGWVAPTRRGEAFYRAGVMAERMQNRERASILFSLALADTAAAEIRDAILIAAFRTSSSASKFYEAERIADAYIAMYPNGDETARILNEAASIYLRALDDPVKSLGFYGRLMEDFPRSSFADDAAFGQAQALRQSGRLREALRAFESFVKTYPASPFVEEAKLAGNIIRLFELKERDAGIGKLALLMGDVIAQRSRGELALRLGDIFFEDLKEYARAAEQYRIAVEAGLPESESLHARHRLALSYRYLLYRESSRADTLRAIAAFDSLLAVHPISAFTEESIGEGTNLKLRLAVTSADVKSIIAKTDVSELNQKLGNEIQLLGAARLIELGNMPDAADMLRAFISSNPPPDALSFAQMLLGEALAAMGETEAAATIYRASVSTGTVGAKQAKAYSFIARSAAAKGDVAVANEAAGVLEERFFYTPESFGMLYIRAEAAFNRKQYGDAFSLFERWVGSLKGDKYNLPTVATDIYYMLAVSAEKSGNLERAKQYYAHFLLREPETRRAGEAMYALAMIARAEKNAELSARYLQESSRLNPPQSGQLDRASFEAAEILFTAEKYADALKRYQDIFTKTKLSDADERDITLRIIVCYFRLNNLKEADTRATRYVRANPSDTTSAALFEYERGRYHLRKEEYDSALKRLMGILEFFPRASIVPEALFWIGRTYELQQKPDLAIPVYDSLLKTFPAHAIAPRARLTLGNLYYALEQWDPAARLFKAVLDSEAQAPDLALYAMNNLIMAYRELGLFDAALQLTRTFIARFPEDQSIIDKRIDIGILLQRLGYFDQSVLHLSNLLESAPPNLEAEIRYYIGEGHFYKGAYQQAILEFLKIPYLVSQRSRADWVSTAFYMAGQSYEKMGKYEQAISMYRQIIARPGVDPQFKTGAQKEIDRVTAVIKPQKQ